jgi:hypothetical protein
MVMSRSIANWSWDNAPSSSSQSSLPESINASAEPEPADGAELTPQPPQSLPTPPPTAAADAHVRELVGLPPHCEQLGVQAHARLAQIEATKAALVAALDAEAGQLKSLLSLLDAQSTVQRTHTAAIVEIAAALEALAAPERPANVLSALTGGADAAELQRALATQAHNALGQLCANAAAAARDGGLPPAEHAETAAARALLGARPAPVSVGSPVRAAPAPTAACCRREGALGPADSEPIRASDSTAAQSTASHARARTQPAGAPPPAPSPRRRPPPESDPPILPRDHRLASRSNTTRTRTSRTRARASPRCAPRSTSSAP